MGEETAEWAKEAADTATGNAGGRGARSAIGGVTRSSGEAADVPKVHNSLKAVNIFTESRGKPT